MKREAESPERRRAKHIPDSILFYSDGLVEAHSPTREMFGFPRLKTMLDNTVASSELIDDLLGKLKNFTGADWEQEDDVTMVTLERFNERLTES